ncbi:winged helix-turn-helix transcriptional regulator [Gryllotalpicola reticulitermitis]|uniref:Winged helix-turn-helix transcriptional regulator n=1 Tax=Gryllotalpicola reticulitermitis TaxID=1184153 RepID=A0ABV8Q8M0_9MICO
MRSYGEFCSIARALDVVGDRWSLLVIRELITQGPLRFTDLKNGLPGIATNLLSTRLKELEEAGVVSRDDAPPPIATALYSLTARGRALEPVLRALGAWGLGCMTAEHPGDAFRPQWLGYAAEWFTSDAEPDAGPATIQVSTTSAEGTSDVAIRLGGGDVVTEIGSAPDAGLTVDGPARPVMGLITGLISRDQASAAGVGLDGDEALLARLVPSAVRMQ